MSYCCVPKCKGRGGFHFPKDKSLRSKWIAAIRRDNFVLKEHTTVCHAHFTADDYRSDLNFQGMIVLDILFYVLFKKHCTSLWHYLV